MRSRPLILLAALLGVATFSYGAVDDSIPPAKFIGIWSGVLSINYAPFNPDQGKDPNYRLEISTDDVRIFIEDREIGAWKTPNVSSRMDTHLLVVMSMLGPAWVEDFSINLIWLDDNVLYAYVSRVVYNFSSDKDDLGRHFPIFLSGELVKDST